MSNFPIVPASGGGGTAKTYVSTFALKDWVEIVADKTRTLTIPHSDHGVDDPNPVLYKEVPPLGDRQIIQPLKLIVEINFDIVITIPEGQQFDGDIVIK